MRILYGRKAKYVFISLGIVLVVCLGVFFTSYFQSQKGLRYRNFEEYLKYAAQTYYSSNGYQEVESTVLSLDELKETDSSLNGRQYANCIGYVEIKNGNVSDIDNYTSHVKCGNSYESSKFSKDKTFTPVLTLEGSLTLELQVGEEYVEPGYYATDIAGQDVTNQVSVQKAINIHKPGTYRVKYRLVVDGKELYKERKVVVKEQATPKPVIKLLGSSKIQIQKGEVFVDPFCTAYDTKDGDLTSSIVVNGSVDTNQSGTYKLTYSVTNSSGKTSNKVSRTVVVKENKDQTKLSADATLASLSTSSGSVQPGFQKNKTSYTMVVPYSDSHITIWARPTSSKATVQGADSSMLSVGVNTFSIVVTAENGSKKTYTLRITRLADKTKDENNYLSSLTYDGKSVPGFKKTKDSYTLNVESNKTSISIGATAESNKARVVGAKTYPLTSLTTTIVVTVYSESDQPKEYELIVKKPKTEEVVNKNLKSLRISNTTISPSFHKNIFDYKAEVSENVDEVRITALLEDRSKAVISSNPICKLNPGINTCSVVVASSSDSSDTQIYTITVTRRIVELSGDNTLKTLTISDGRLSPNFQSDVTDYTVINSKDPSQLTIKAKANHAKAITSSNMSKEGNYYVYRVYVKAENGQNKVYTIRAPEVDKTPVSNALTSLKVEGANEDLHFSKDTLHYEVTVDQDVTSVLISAVLEDSRSTVDGLGKKDVYVGTNTFRIRVKDIEGKRRTYEVRVIRSKGDKKDTNSFLSMISIQNYSLSPAFSPSVKDYTVYVPSTTTSVNIKLTSQSPTATVYGGGMKTISSKTSNFTVGAKSQSGDTSVYHIRIEKSNPNGYVPSPAPGDGSSGSASGNTNIKGLTSLQVKVGSSNYLSGFSNTKTSYIVDVPAGTNFINIVATSNEKISGHVGSLPLEENKCNSGWKYDTVGNKKACTKTAKPVTSPGKCSQGVQKDGKCYVNPTINKDEYTCDSGSTLNGKYCYTDLVEKTEYSCDGGIRADGNKCYKNVTTSKGPECKVGSLSSDKKYCLQYAHVHSGKCDGKLIDGECTKPVKQNICPKGGTYSSARKRCEKERNSKDQCDIGWAKTTVNGKKMCYRITTENTDSCISYGSSWYVKKIDGKKYCVNVKKPEIEYTCSEYGSSWKLKTINGMKMCAVSSKTVTKEECDSGWTKTKYQGKSMCQKDVKIEKIKQCPSGYKETRYQGRRTCYKDAKKSSSNLKCPDSSYKITAVNGAKQCVKDAPKITSYTCTGIGGTLLGKTCVVDAKKEQTFKVKAGSKSYTIKVQTSENAVSHPENVPSDSSQDTSGNSNAQKSGTYKLTYYGADYSAGVVSSNGLVKDSVGRWTYNGRLVVAAATEECLASNIGGCASFKTRDKNRYYFHYGETLSISFNGSTYSAVVLDSCGECMRSSKPALDLLVHGVRENGRWNYDYYTDSYHKKMGVPDITVR